MSDEGSEESVPLIVPIRGHLDTIRRMLRGDFYIGRGSRQLGLSCSEFANDLKVSVHGREVSISKFTQKLAESDYLKSQLRSLSGKRLVCHCRPGQACHGDAIISALRERFPEAFDRSASDTSPPSADILAYLAHLRTEPEEEEQSSPDEGAQPTQGGEETGQHSWSAAGIQRENCVTGCLLHLRADGHRTRGTSRTHRPGKQLRL